MYSDEITKTDDPIHSPAVGSVDMEPDNAIDPAIHKRAILKLDTVVCGCFGMMYLLANLDRNNLVRFPPLSHRPTSPASIAPVYIT